MHGATQRCHGIAPLVKELDFRRRVNVLYPNPQSLFDGLQAGFVNVGTGNLTFLRRDLVALAGGPVTFARVYDSRGGGNEDFGPGWRLNLAEELVVDDAGITYIDRAGASRRFAKRGGSYVLEVPSPRHYGTRIALDGRQATLLEADGTERTFKAVGDSPLRLSIASVTTGARMLDFRYQGGRLASVAHGRNTVFVLSRGPHGRVVATADRHGRSVRYSYTGDGRLKDVYDLAGNLWWHEYDSEGRLTAGIGANGRAYLRAAYDKDGRATASRTGREYAFSYSPGSTTVTEGTGVRHVFEQNAAGATVALSSTTGTWWRIGLNANSRIKVLEMRGRSLEYDYDAKGNVTMVVETASGSKTVTTYSYDSDGRLVARNRPEEKGLSVAYAGSEVRLTGSQEFRYEISPSGNVTAVRDASGRIDAEYGSDGRLMALRQGTASARFEYDVHGRLAGTTYPNGEANRYFYDAIGNRNLVEYGSGGSVGFRHDAAGNIIGAEVVEADGRVRRQTTTVGDMNRVERIVYEGTVYLDIRYDAMGRPVAFESDGETVSVSYDERGRPSRYLSSTGASWVPPSVDEAEAGHGDRATQLLTVLAAETAIAPQPDYGPVSFAETTFDPHTQDAPYSVPALAAARALLAVAVPLFSPSRKDSVEAFEKPSNPAFQPAEYRSTNCCIPYAGETCGPDGPTGPGGACSADNLDSAAKTELMTYAQEPFERGFALVCSGSFPQVTNKVDSNPERGGDPCSVPIPGVAGAAAYGHSHPYFRRARQMNSGSGCHGRRNWEQWEAEETNRANRDFSQRDMARARASGVPLYLITPNRGRVKVYRQDLGGAWRPMNVN